MTSLLSIDIPEDAAPLDENSQIDSGSVFLYDLLWLVGKNVHVMFSDGQSLTGLLHSVNGNTFKVGQSDLEELKTVTSFRAV